MTINDLLTDDAAGYLLHLEDMVRRESIDTREALLRAFNAGTTRGQIQGIEQAKKIIAGKP
jgi:hypothetical protein